MKKKERKEGRAKGGIEKTLLISLIIFGGLFIIGIGSASTVTVSAEAPPDLVSYTISNRTITPPQTTSIDVAFSERVKYTIAIEKDAETIYDWSGTATNPAAKVWDGTDEASDEAVPVGVYSVSVTGVSTETGLSVINNTETITVSGEGSTLDTITISPSIAEVAVGNTRQFMATAYDQNSNTMSGVAITWSSGNTTVGTVSPTTATTGADGTATTTFSALAEGTTTVVATNGFVSDSASVTTTAAASEITATRDISDQTVTPGETFTVTVVVTANQPVSAPALDEDLPTGWTVTEVDSAGATYKESTHEWLWMSSLVAGANETVIYNITVPSNATTGSYTVTGSVSADDVAATAVSGESEVTVATTTDWNPWDDDGIITTAEIQETVNYWLTDTPINGHTVTTAEMQELVNMWLTT